MLQSLLNIHVGAYCLYLSIVASSKRILGHNIFVNIFLLPDSYNFEKNELLNGTIKITSV